MATPAAAARFAATGSAEPEVAGAGAAAASEHPKPRLGFIGTGWIGAHRLRSLAEAEVAQVVALADAVPEACAAAARWAPDAKLRASLAELLEEDLDGLVVATPSALHAEQATAALERGLAVFCQKPLGRTAAETRAVIEAARAADRMLDVDLSYRRVRGVQAIRELLAAGALGRVYGVDLVFHNAYGPDKAWFYDAALSGGGCVMDLGIHLVDLALWALDWPDVRAVTARLFAGGEPLPPGSGRVEDYAVARLDLATGAAVQLACSWKLPAGRDAVIGAAFWGTEGGAALRNVDGSFYDFMAERYRGTERELLAHPPDDWGGRAIVSWARRLAAGGSFDPAVERLTEVARALDGIYGR